MPPLDPLPPVAVSFVEVLRLRMPLAVPLRSSRGETWERDVLLVHVVAMEAEGWAECPVEAAPTYSGEFTDATALVFRHHIPPASLGDAVLLGEGLRQLRGQPMAVAALQLAVLDAQLKAAGRSLASWLGGTATAVAPGAALSLHDEDADLLTEADEALAAGAVRLRVKIAPEMGARPLAKLRAHIGDDVPLQADANGSFSADDPELREIDELGLVCLEQPLHPDDLLGSARLADRMATPICLDEPLTSLRAIEAAIEVGACDMVCLKPSRVGFIEARAVHDRCAELGVPVWVGGMLETGLGRAANLAVASLPHFALPPDLDPRGRFAPDLCDPRLPVGGLVPVPTEPGIGATPDPEIIEGAEQVAHWYHVEL
jgi:o-succinylbenzoate synthase